jgi:FkbM family methyltransferase
MRQVTIGLGRLFDGRDAAVFGVHGDRKIRISLSDPYWIPPLLLRGTYEPEVAALVSIVLTEESSFIDCGANIGWWSIFATTIIPRADRILAVEPASRMYSQLARNAELNGNAFTCVRAAVWNTASSQLPLHVEPHHDGRSSIELSSATQRQGPHRTEMVPSITLQELIDRYLGGRSEAIVVKLDVEGAELQAMSGAGSYAEAMEMIVYEDHGKDPRPRVSEAMIQAGFAIFHCDDSIRIHKIENAEIVQAVKRNRRRGYNFAAARPGSRAWTRLSERCAQ